MSWDLRSTLEWAWRPKQSREEMWSCRQKEAGGVDEDAHEPLRAEGEEQDAWQFAGEWH